MYPVLQNIGKEITQNVKPKAVVVFSAHWQAKPDLIHVNNAVENDLIYESVSVMSLDALHVTNRVAVSMAFLTTCTRRNTQARAIRH